MGSTGGSTPPPDSGGSYYISGEPTPIMRFFYSEHLPAELRLVARAVQDLATVMDQLLPGGAEKSAGLRKLLEAKDCFVRASLPVLARPDARRNRWPDEPEEGPEDHGA